MYIPRDFDSYMFMIVGNEDPREGFGMLSAVTCETLTYIVRRCWVRVIRNTVSMINVFIFSLRFKEWNMSRDWPYQGYLKTRVLKSPK